MFVSAIFLESNVVGYSSLILLGVSFLMFTLTSWCNFINMSVIELSAYDANSLSNLNVDLMYKHAQMSNEFKVLKYIKPASIVEDGCFG